MNKRIKNVFSLASCMLFTIPLTATVSCSDSSSENLNDKVLNSFNNLITEESAKKIDNLLFSNFKQNINNEITHEMIIQEIELNNNNFLNQELMSLNKYDEYKEKVAESVLLSYNNEVQHEESKQKQKRHGSIFKKHFWVSLGYQMISSYLIVYSSAFWWSLQIGSVVVMFAKTLDGAAFADAISSFSFNVPSLFVILAENTIQKVKEFKSRTKCKWTYIVWNSGGYLVKI